MKLDDNLHRVARTKCTPHGLKIQRQLTQRPLCFCTRWTKNNLDSIRVVLLKIVETRMDAQINARDLDALISTCCLVHPSVATPVAPFILRRTLIGT